MQAARPLDTVARATGTARVSSAEALVLFDSLSHSKASLAGVMDSWTARAAQLLEHRWGGTSTASGRAG